MGFRMHAAVALSAALCCGASARAQDVRKADPPRTKFESFLDRDGFLLVKTFHPVGELKWAEGVVKIEAVHAGEFRKKDREAHAILFEKPAQGVNQSTRIAFVDWDETEALLAAVNEMITLAKESARAAPRRMEVDFSLRSGARIGFIQEGYKQSALLQVGPSKRGLVTSRIGELSTLKSLLEDAMKKLRELGAH